MKFHYSVCITQNSIMNNLAVSMDLCCWVYYPYYFIFMQIRKASAEQVYLVLLQNGNLVAEDKLEKAVEIIAETCWEGEVEAIKHQRLELHDLAGLDAGLLANTNKISSKDSGKRPNATDENASYSSLVGSTGF